MTCSAAQVGSEIGALRLSQVESPEPRESGERARRSLTRGAGVRAAPRRLLLLAQGRQGVEEAQVADFGARRHEIRRRLGWEVIRRDLVPLDDVPRVVRAEGVDAAMIMVSWREDPERVTRVFRALHERPGRPTLYFLDYYAQTSSPMFGVLPYVDAYLKRQTLRDTALYQRRYEGGYIFADYFARRYAFDLRGWGRASIPDREQVRKIRPIWSLSVRAGSRHQLALSRALGRRFRRRPIDLNVRLGIGPEAHPDDQWYEAHRRAALRAAAALRGSMRVTGSERVSFRAYVFEMLRSKMTLSPFGWGEVCFRDYESVCLGSLLLKPDMRHVETTPDIYRPFETYVPIAWDFADLEEKARHYEERPDEAEAIVARARGVMRDYFRRDEFVRTLGEILQVHEQRVGARHG